MEGVVFDVVSTWKWVSSLICSEKFIGNLVCKTLHGVGYREVIDGVNAS